MNESDLQRLIDDGVAESRNIDYKLELPGPTDSEKKEFLGDVSSFANTSGGKLFLGIREENRLPVELVGIPTGNEDEVVQRIENLLRHGLEPRLPSIRIDPIPLTSARVVYVLDIPRSWALPHRVSLGGHHKFYARNSAGKYPVDVPELRNLFAQSEALSDRMRKFRHDRLAAIQAGETPLGLGAWAKLVIHLIPLQAFEPGAAFDLSHLEDRVTKLRPLFAVGWDYRHNFEGFVTFATQRQENTTLTYLQVFRTGILEAADRLMLKERDGRKYIPSVSFEEKLATALGPYLSFQAELGVQPPVYIGLSLLGVKGYYMAVSEGLQQFNVNKIDRDDLILPEVAVEDFTANPFQLLRPIFDIVWNAAGWPASINYSSEGAWKGGL